MVSAYDIAASVVDPEIRVLTIADLGVLRDVSFDGSWGSRRTFARMV